MFSPLSRGYGTWTGNYDPYNEEGADSDSPFPEIEEPHRHGITVGFVSRTPSATAVSPPYRISSHHHNGREATLSGKRVSFGRDVSPTQMSRENSDAKMNLPKTFLTRKGALMLFSAPENEEESLIPSRSAGPRPRYMRLRKSADLIDTSLKLGTMDKLAMSVLQYGEEEIDKDKENTKVSDEKNQLFMKFLTKVDQRDVDERAQPGGDVRYYLNDLKYKTSLQMGFTGDTSLPRSREALELRAILRGLQNDRWPVTYRQEGPDFRQPSSLAYQFSRPPSHLDHPPRNQYQRILSSRKLEDSVQSLRSCLGRSLDAVDEGPQHLLPKRHGKYKDDAGSARRNRYQQGMPDDDFGKRLRPHTNIPTHVEGIVIKNAANEEDEDEVEEEQYLDAKSSARDDGYYSVSQGDSCSFVLGPRNWTPVNSQAPKDEIVKPKVQTVDVKKTVDRGSSNFDDDESSADEGLDGDGLVVGIADGSEESDVEIIYSNLGVPDNTLDTFEGYHSNNTSFQANSVKSISPDLTNQNTLVEGENSIVSKEIESAITPQQNDLTKNSSENLSKMEEKDVNFASSSIKNVPHVNTDNVENNIVGTSPDDENYNNDPEFIASDGEDIDGLIEAENELKLISNKKESANRAISSASSHKRSMSRTPSSMHSTAHDDDQSSVTIIPHDQDLISVDVRSAKISQFVSNQNNAQAMEEDSQVTDNLAPTSEALTLVKDTESCVTGDDATSYAMSMGEDSSTVIQTLRDLHGDEEERRDQVGEIIDTRLPRDDRVRNDMNEIPLPTTLRSTEITTEDKMSPHDVKSESPSKLDEKEEVKEVDPKTLVSTQVDVTPGREKTEMPTIPDFLKPKPQSKSQQRKDQKKKGMLQKGRRDSKTPPKDPKIPPKDAKTPPKDATIPPKDATIPPKDATTPPKDATTPPEDVSKAMDITSVKPDEEEEEITQVIRKKVTLPPEKEHSIIPDFVSEAIQRSAERSKQQLEKEFKEQQELIGQEISDTLYEGEEGMTAEEFELAKKALKEKEETTKEKLVKGKQTTKKVEEKGRKSGGSSSIRSKKSKGPAIKDPLQQEKDRIKAVKEQEKRKRLEEIKLLEEKIQASSNSVSAEDKKFKDKLQEVQMELERIEREAHMAEQTEADVRQALKEDRMKRLDEKAKQKKEELARRRMLMMERKLQERQLKEEARQRESQKIMMLLDDEERKKRQDEEKKKQEDEEREEEKRRREEEDELARLDREEEERRRQLEEEIEQDQLKRLQEEQDEIRKQQEAIVAQKEALLEEQRRKRELLALEEQRQQEELDRIQREEMKKLEEERARMQELQRLEEEVRENMRLEMEQRKENAIKRRECNIESKSNLNRIRHSQGITRPWVWSYFIQWPMETYMRPVGEQEKMKKEAKLRAKRKKAR